MFWLLANLWAALDGFCDALYYSRLGAEAFAWNEHRALVARRALVVAIALAAGFDAMMVAAGDVLHVPVWCWWLLWEVVALALSFSLFHNEAYNFGRLLINVQNLRRAWEQFEFNYQSPTTTARWDFDGTARWVLAGAAVVVLFIGMFLLARLN